MIRTCRSIKSTLLLVSFTLVQSLHGQAPESIAEREVSDYQNDLQTLESEYGYSDPALLETLTGLADRLMELGEYAGAHSALDRAQQIIRYNEGLYSLNQLPYLHKKIENMTTAGNWADVRSLQDHLFWLYTERYPNRDPELIDGLLQAAEFHLQGVLRDSPDYASYHYRAAAIHARVALYVGESIWAPNDRRLVPLYYEQLRHAYLQALAINRGGSIAASLRSRATVYGYETRGGFMLDEQVAIGMHRASGFRYLESLRFLFTHPQSPDPEAAAMVSLYEADWQVLYRRYDDALQSYARARDELIAAGVEPERVDTLLATPVLIPEPEFHASVEAALAGRSEELADYVGPMQILPVRLSFNMPPSPTLASIPQIVDGLGFAEDDATVFVFRLPGQESLRGSFWRPRHYSLGAAQDIRLLDRGFSNYVEQEALLEDLSWLRFRPSFSNGAARAVHGILGFMLQGSQTPGLP